MSKVTVRHLPTKSITARGKVVTVETAHHVSENGQHHFLVQATHDGITEVSPMTIGAVDGERPDFSLEDLQAALEKHRERVADECAWKHHVHKITHEVQ
jgi:hypothetical protein